MLMPLCGFKMLGLQMQCDISAGTLRIVRLDFFFKSRLVCFISLHTVISACLAMHPTYSEHCK